MRPSVPRWADHQEHLRRLREAALEAVDPGAAVARALSLSRGVLRVGRRRLRLGGGRILLVAMGKAAVPMCRAAVEALGGRVATGVAAGPEASLGHLPAGVEGFAGGHPLPSTGSLTAGQRVAALLSNATEEDIVIALVSGGGSAMLEHPQGRLTLDHLRAANGLLLRSGLPIDDINTIRSSLSRIKAGGLTRMASPARVVGLVLSDVPGDDLRAVASGPTVERPDPRPRAAAILRRTHLWDRMPEEVRRSLLASALAPGRHPPAVTLLVASNRSALDAAAREARALGFAPESIARPLRGEAGPAGRRLARRLLRCRRSTCLLAGGETTVAVEDGGKGGRSQELALQAAIDLEGCNKVALMAFGTDGIDGPTDAAGAIVTGATARALRDAGWDPTRALEAHDSYSALDAVGALLRTGPTGTNVGDLVVGLRYAA